jgi:23S rRNA (cytosine1962-C5)-methyltransferase
MPVIFPIEDPMSDLTLLKLKKNEERRLKSGHLWIFSNEIDTQATPLRGLEPGCLVAIESSRGEALGVGYANPESLIAVRLLTRNPRESLGVKFFVHRIERALMLRERIYEKPHYRLIYGESDGLPGVVVDRFGDLLVVQSNTAGMDRMEGEFVEALTRVLSPRTLVIRNTSGLRSLEGLSERVEVVVGTLDADPTVEENGAVFGIDPLEGQKTGWFFDHRDNRARLAPWCRGRRVLDLFAYSGAWGIPSAMAGAEHVDAVDASESALDLLKANAHRNGVGDRVAGHAGDVFDFLRQAREERHHWDVVIADPPAFIKRKKDLAKGVEAYRRLNQMALQVLSPGGILVAASCSYHLPRETLKDHLRASGRHLDRHLVILAEGGQGPDHPVHPAIPETDYLKAVFCQVGPSL